jgi:ribosomal protein S18 acetylase RimI-like enzyme
METDRVIYQVGIPESFREAVVELYDEAFAEKISLAIPDDEKRFLLLSSCMMLDYVIGAFSQGRLIGIAGFHIQSGALTGGKLSLRDLISLLGFFDGIKAALILSAYQRKPKPKELLMDGICVHSCARGKGVGSGLLGEIQSYAVQHGFVSIRLDVVDTNPEAKKLYERMGFEVVKTESFPWLEKYLGFGGASTMEYKTGTRP